LGHTVEQWILRQSDELYAVRGLFIASQSVEREEFQAFARDAINRRAGVLSKQWIPRIIASDRRRFEREAGVTRSHGISIREIRDLQDTVLAPNRDTYFPVLYVVPDSLTQKLVGLDFAADRDFVRKSDEVCRSNGMLVMINPKYSVARTGIAAMQVFLPVYRNGAPQGTPAQRQENLMGFVAAEYDWSEMIKPVFDALDTSDFRFSVADVTNAFVPLYSIGIRPPEFPVSAREKPAQGEWIWRSEFGFGDRRFAIAITPSETFAESERMWPPRAAFVGVLLLAGLIAWYTYLNNRKLHRIRTLVAITRQSEADLTRINVELGESRRFIESVMNSNPSIIYIFDLQRETPIYVNNGVHATLGYSDGEIYAMGGSLLRRLMHPDDFRHYQLETLPQYQQTADEQVIERQFRMQHKSGAWLWFSCVERIFTRDSGGAVVQIAGILQDITARWQAEHDLAASREMLQMVLDTIPVTVFWKDRKSCFLGGNKMFTVDAGVASMSDIVGKSDWDMSWRVEAENFRRDDLEVMTSGVPKIGYEEPQTRSDGSIVWLRTNKIPLVNTWGQIIGILGSYEDITERKQMLEALKESEERYRTVVERAWDGIFRADSEGRYTDVNDSGCRIIGYAREEILGRTLQDLLDPADVEDNPIQYQQLKAGQVVTNERRLKCKDGTLLSVEICTQMLPGGELIGLVRDISVRKQAEAAIQELNAALEQRVKDRTAELEAANKELEAFAYSVSHDLRAPLRGIDGFSQAILEDYQDKLDEAGQDYLNRIRRASQRMAQLIDDILGLSRLTRGELTRETIDLSDLTRHISEELTQSHPARAVEFVIDDDVVGSGDSRLMNAVMENLLRNAWKFTAKTDAARIEFGTVDQDGAQVYFVRDNGVGFDMAYVDKLFGVFQRLHSSTEFEGNGIGLATVQRIIHRHGGRVWADGALGKGATFYFTLKP
jgi:PAS domain S-box-containing protein